MNNENNKNQESVSDTLGTLIKNASNKFQVLDYYLDTDIICEDDNDIHIQKFTFKGLDKHGCGDYPSLAIIEEQTEAGENQNSIIVYDFMGDEIREFPGDMSGVIQAFVCMLNEIARYINL